MKPVKALIESLINGNLTDAKDKATKFSYWKLMSAADEMGYNIVQQVAIAGYLKNRVDFQCFCDTMDKNK
jgi:hypothetical protein